MKNIGKKCYIKNKDSEYFGEWGIIKSFDGDFYHVAIANGTDSLPIFDRSEIQIPRKQKGERNE